MQTIFRKIEASEGSSLIVHYDVASASSQTSERGTNSFKQVINISKPANQNVDIRQLAAKILKRCDIIPKMRLPELFAALLQLNKNGGLSSTASYEFPFAMQNFLSTSSLFFAESTDGSSDSFDVTKVSIGKLDFYIELLYEELEEKIKGALSILNLVTKPEHLNSLSKNDTLLCALSRVLREDGKKSLELSIYIAAIFSHFSNYVDFHFTISNYKVGSTCLELIYFEILREESWCKELSQKRNISENQLENLKAKLSYEKLLVSYQNLVKKQNIFFKYSLYILMNISEDLKLEYKIINKGIISILYKLLERNSQELLLVIVIYLKKLSVFIENKAAMKDLNLMKSLSPLLFLDNELLIFNTLKLMYNLSIDREMRIYFIRCGIFSKLVSFFTKGAYTSVIVSLFYLVSCEAKYVTIFANHPQLVGLLMEKALMNNLEYRTVLYNLLANLAANYHLAQAMLDCSDSYNELLKLTFTLQQPADAGNCLALLRFCRNISCHSDALFKLSLIGHQERILTMMMSSDLRQKSDQLVECAGILTNLSLCQPASAVQTAVGIDWVNLYRKHAVDGFLRKIFNQQWADKKAGELALRYVLLLVAASAHQSEVTTFLYEQNIIDRLIDLLNANQENDEIVLNIIYCFYVFVKVGVELREQIFQQTKLSDYLIDLMYDRNFKIKSLCTATLDMIADDGSEFAMKIKHEKFNAYNNKWLSMIQNDRSSDESSHSMLEDMFIYPDLFLKVDLLNDSSSENFSDDNQAAENGGGAAVAVVGSNSSSRQSK